MRIYIKIEECLYEDTGFKPCEIQAMDCENCEYFDNCVEERQG